MRLPVWTRSSEKSLTLPLGESHEPVKLAPSPANESAVKPKHSMSRIRKLRGISAPNDQAQPRGTVGTRPHQPLVTRQIIQGFPHWLTPSSNSFSKEKMALGKRRRNFSWSLIFR